jgi:hypothetical protein
MLGVDLVPLDATGVARRAGLRVERDGYTRDLAFIASTRAKKLGTTMTVIVFVGPWFGPCSGMRWVWRKLQSDVVCIGDPIY